MSISIAAKVLPPVVIGLVALVMASVVRKR
jgi:hypothetical protein